MRRPITVHVKPLSNEFDRRTSKKSVKFSMSNDDSLDVIPHLSHVSGFDGEGKTDSCLLNMSMNMNNYERCIVSDVLRIAVEKVHQRGMGYQVQDNQAYYDIIDIIADTMKQVTSPEEEALETIHATLESVISREDEVLSNLDNVLSLLDDFHEGSVWQTDKNATASISSLNQLSNFDINTGFSFEGNPDDFGSDDEEATKSLYDEATNDAMKEDDYLANS